MSELQLTDGPGNDLLDGGTGDDSIRMRDGGTDTADCGAGLDVAVADAADVVTGCEVVQTPPVAPTPTPTPTPAPDSTAPVPAFAGAKVVGSRLVLKATCPASEVRCVGEASLKVTGKKGRKKVAVKPGRVLVVVDGGATKALRLTLSGADRRVLAGLARPG